MFVLYICNLPQLRLWPPGKRSIQVDGKGMIKYAGEAIPGRLYKLTPDQVAATLTKEQQTLKRKGGNIYIAVVLAPDPRWQKIGQLVPKVQYPLRNIIRKNCAKIKFRA
ncbi:MAG: hypothetical protein IPH91_07660 [Elusimicrobia bacterium]|nr:hypothetical protein [Elusimicrobiota bacterium]